MLRVTIFQKGAFDAPIYRPAIFQFLLIIFIANSLTFLLPRIIPGDPIQEALQVKAAAAGRQNVDIQAWVATYNAKFGLDQPLWKQYLNYW